MTTAATGRIMIIKLPQGEAPESVRRAWIGRILPCHPVLGFSSGDELSLYSKVRVRKRYGFSVPQDLAIEILREFSPEAARWFEENGFPESDRCFCFDESEAQILCGVTRQTLYQHSDLDGGRLR